MRSAVVRKIKFQPWGSLNVVTRSVVRQGAVFNWSGIDRLPAAAFTVTATRDTEFLYIPAAAVAAEAARNPEFGFAYLQRALWLMGQYFLAARAPDTRAGRERDFRGRQPDRSEGCRASVAFGVV